MSEIVEYKGFSALLSIGFQAYKSFSGNDFIEIPLHSNLTLIIGRNNSGKSSLIDVIGAAINPEKRRSGISGLKYGFYLDSFHLERGFSKGTSGSHLNNYSSDYAFAEQFINQVFMSLGMKVNLSPNPIKNKFFFLGIEIILKNYLTGIMLHIHIIRNYPLFVCAELMPNVILFQKKKAMMK